MKHVLIGGNGFVGRELVRRLIEEAVTDILVIDLPESFDKYPELRHEAVRYARIDIGVPRALDEIALDPGDVVHHLATRLITPNKPRFGRDEYFRYCAVNGTREVLAWMKRSGARSLVFWSTDMVYGPAIETPRRESHPRRPFGPYGRSKVAAEDLIGEAVKAGDVHCTIFRPRLILGPGRLGILEVLFKAADMGLPMPLIGPGENRFQFVSVADCARASALAAKAGCPNGVFNLGTDNSPTEYELLTGFVKQIGSNTKIIRTPGWLVKFVLRLLDLVKISPLDPEQFEIADLEVTLDTSAAKRDLGWVSTQSDEELLLAAFRSYKDARCLGHGVAADAKLKTNWSVH